MSETNSTQSAPEPKKHRRGDVREDGLVFLRYDRVSKKTGRRNEVWLPREEFDKRAAELREYSRKFQVVQYAKDPVRITALRRDYYQRNRERRNAQAREWQKRNPRKVLDAIAAWRRKAVVRDPTIRAIANMRCRIYAALVGRLKASNTFKLLGCSDRAEYKTILEQRFLPGMTWANYGKVWHVDHVVPCRRFDMLDAFERQVCFHHSNLQPLWRADNMSKGAEATVADVDLVLSRCPDTHRPILLAKRAGLEKTTPPPSPAKSTSSATA